jgi:Zn-dependent protease
VDIANIIQKIAVFAVPLLLAITLHEAAHAYVARYFGDDTAAMLGRVTLNPLKHIDPIGTILMPAFLYIATQGHFSIGYAKPVPVRMRRLHNPQRDMIWVALAGPASNLLQALCWGILPYLLFSIGVRERFFFEVCSAGMWVNVVLFAFNLFPLPPLDGGRILVGLLPRRAALTISRVEPWGFFIVIALVATNVINRWWMDPLMDTTLSLLRALLSPLKALLT